MQLQAVMGQEGKALKKGYSGSQREAKKEQRLEEEEGSLPQVRRTWAAQ